MKCVNNIIPLYGPIHPFYQPICLLVVLGTETPLNV